MSTTQTTAAPAAETKAERQTREDRAEIERRVAIAQETRARHERSETAARDHWANQDRMRQDREAQLRAAAAKVPLFVWTMNRPGGEEVSDEDLSLLIVHGEHAAEYPRAVTKQEIRAREEEIGAEEVESLRSLGLGVRAGLVQDRQKAQSKFMAKLWKLEAARFAATGVDPKYAAYNLHSAAADIRKGYAQIREEQARVALEERQATERAAAAAAEEEQARAAISAAVAAEDARAAAAATARDALAKGAPPPGGWSGLVKRLGLSTGGAR